MSVLLFLMGVVLILALAAASVLAWPYLVDYRVGPTGIELLAFRTLPVATIPFASIASVSCLGDAEKLTLREKVASLRLGNRPWKIRDAVAIRKRNGFIRLVVITPSDPDEFVREVKSRLTVTADG